MNRQVTDSQNKYNSPKNTHQVDIKNNTISSINDFRGKISLFIQYEDMRNKMIHYFKGSSDEMWFIQEILVNLYKIINFNSGCLFIIEISKKIAFPIPEWSNFMIQKAETLLLCDSGPNIFLILLSIMDSSQIYELSDTIFTNFHKWADSNFSFQNSSPRINNLNQHKLLIKILFKKLIIFCRQDIQYFKPLLLIDYFQNIDYLFILELLIQETNLAASVKVILDNFDFCAKTSQFTSLIIFLYEKKDKSVRQFIFNRLISKHKACFLKEPQWEIFRAVSIDGELAHREAIAEILAENLNHDKYPWYFEQYLVSILFSLPFNARIEFIKLHHKELLKFTNFPQFSMLLQYMELLFE